MERRAGTSGCTATALGGATSPTADVQLETLCLRCAQAARVLLPVEEHAKPHGKKILAAAARHMWEAGRDRR